MSTPDSEDTIYIDKVVQLEKIHQFTLPNDWWQRGKCQEIGIEFIAELPSKFNHDMEREFQCVSKGHTEYSFWCTICHKDISCAHSAKNDVQRHMTTKSHITNSELPSNKFQIDSFFQIMQQRNELL